MREVTTAVKGRLSGKSSGSGGGSSSSGGGSGGNAVVDLSESSFRKDVLNSEDLWLVAFVAPWW